VAGVLRACQAPGVAGEVINLAAGRRVSLLELVATLQRILGTTVAPVFGPPRDGDVRDSQADISKAVRLLGFEATVSFEEGLRRTVAWHRSASAVKPARG
jgi:nucleoside-diphosphate-sugar epimerase